MEHYSSNFTRKRKIPNVCNSYEKQFEIIAEADQEKVENVQCDLWWKGILFQTWKYFAMQKELN